ncbi:MAG: alpha/beta fold hydrolase [Elusimicrobia bacterium]|nr:alpha/beta fold hydrolase [Elusimicrobiota bacterium]
MTLTATLFLFVLILALILLAGGYYGSQMILHSPDRDPIEFWPDQFQLTYESVVFRTSDGVQLKGWFIPSSNGGSKTILLCHGWGANKGKLLASTEFLNRKGDFNLFYFDFRTHGQSGGSRASLGLLEARDFDAATQFLKDHKPEFASRLGTYGLSLGGAVALLGAARHPEYKAVCVESTFCSYNQVVLRYASLFFHCPRPLGLASLAFMRLRLGEDPEPYSAIYHARKLAPRPILIIHGDNDPRMPLQEARALYAECGEPKELWIVSGADHGKCREASPEEYERRLLAFFEKNI